MMDDHYSIEVPAPFVYQKDFDWIVYHHDKRVAYGSAPTSAKAFEAGHRAKAAHQKENA